MAKFELYVFPGIKSAKIVSDDDNYFPPKSRQKEVDDISDSRPEEFNFDNEIPKSNEDQEEEKISLTELQEEVQKAYDQGFTDGQETTRATFQAQIQQHQRWLRNLDSVIADLRSQYTKSILDMEETVISLSIMVAKHVLEREVSLDSEVIITQVRKAINTLDNDIIFKIRLHPSNIETLEKAKSRLINDAAMAKQVLLIADESIDQGGCVLETSAGTIDARIKSQLMKISESLMEESQIQSTPDDQSLFDEFEE